MIARILTFLFLALVVTVVAVWLLGGGIGKAVIAAKSMGNPLTYFLQGGPLGSDFRLPGQPVVPLGVDVSQYTGEGGGNGDLAAEYASLAQEYDDLNARVNEARSFGTPSPYASAVSLRVEDPGTEGEYVVIEASAGNTDPVIFTGWTIQSAFTRTRVGLPHAASAFSVGAANTISPVALPPGGTIIVSSGVSPVGVSFRENICVGYLGQLQRYTPPFPALCPAPFDTIPPTDENVRRLGSSCFDYLASVPSCTFPGSAMPDTLSPACRATVAERLTYNGCVRSFSSRADFYTNRWRLFLGMQSSLWNPARDAVRLLDAQGRTVATYSY